MNNRKRDTVMHFWRTTQQQEIDLVEETNGKFSAYEFKWSPIKTLRFPQTFIKNYEVEETKVISPASIEEFIM